MSRTYRRKNSTRNGMWCDLEWYTSDWIHPWIDSGCWHSVRIPFEKGSEEWKKGVARFHSDGATNQFKEPGPSWFRNIFQRKYRRKAERELQKFMMDEDYEPMIERMPVMDYWT